MARTGLGLLAGAVVTGCAPGMTAGPGSARGAPEAIRVGLVVGSSSVTIGSTGKVVATLDGGRSYGLSRGDRATMVAVGDELRVREWDGSVRFHRMVLTPAAGGAAVTVSGIPYRGAVDVVAKDGTVTVVNRVGIEAYLVAVVGSEMGTREKRDGAAVQAQAVASRTYALGNLGRYEALGFDLRASTADQAYGGVPAETEMSRWAVESTRGLVAAESGHLIDAFYHSTCGPTTASPGEVFRSVPDAPYLRPTSDARDDGGYFNDISPRYSWTVEWTGDELASTLRDRLPGVLGVDPAVVDTVHDVYVYRTGPSGRPAEVRVVVDSGEIPVFGPDIRSVFVTPSGAQLYSTFIRLTAERSGGRVTRLRADGYGYGHGVGLCQWGAIGRARAGYDFRSIIAAYYQGATVERWY